METVVIYIAALGVMAVIFQSCMGALMKMFGAKRTVLLGLFCEALHMLWFSFSTYDWYVVEHSKRYYGINYMNELFSALFHSQFSFHFDHFISPWLVSIFSVILVVYIFNQYRFISRISPN